MKSQCKTGNGTALRSLYQMRLITLNNVHIHRKENNGLGSKLIIALNLCDLLISIFSATASLASVKAAQMGKFRADIEKHDDDISYSNDTIQSIIVAQKRYNRFDCGWKTSLFVPLCFFVQNSCLVTVLLSSTRMIAMARPLYVIKKKIVWRFFAVSSILLLILAIIKTIFLFQAFQLNEPDEFLLQITLNLNEVSKSEVNQYMLQALSGFAFVQVGEFFILNIMVIVVAVCSGITIKVLKSPIVEPGEVNNDSHNRQATVMVLLLALAFVFINGVWLAVAAYFYTKFLFGFSFELVVGMQFIGVSAMMINSVVNPFIYIARNSGLRKYTKEFLLRFSRSIFRRS